MITIKDCDELAQDCELDAASHRKPAQTLYRKYMASFARQLRQQHRTVEASAGEYCDPRADGFDAKFFRRRSIQFASEARIASPSRGCPNARSWTP